jgi:hypothetical protein
MRATVAVVRAEMNVILVWKNFWGEESVFNFDGGFAVPLVMNGNA